MSTEIKPGQVWAWSNGNRVVVVAVEADKVSYQYLDPTRPDSSLGVSGYDISGWLRNLSLVTEVATPAPLDPSADDALAASVQRLGKVWLEYRDQQVRGAAKALDVVAASIQQVVDAANAAHQPAPKPEWKPGTVGTATVQPFGADVRVLRSNSGRGWYCEAGFFEDAEVTGFVPDEPRPLPTRNELVKAMHDDYLKGGEPRLTVTAREHLADAVLTFLRGESR